MEHICLRIKSKDTFVCVVESCSFSYQRYASVIKGHTIRELCFCIAVELPKGTKNLVVLVDSIFEKKLFYKAEELAESTHTHQWNKGFEIQPDLCTAVSYLTHCHIWKRCKLFNKNYF